MNPAPPIHALLIGIDQYLPPAAGQPGHYPNLRGCVRDVLQVKRWLVDDRRVPPECIETLLAPAGSDPAAPTPSTPTYENMVAAFRRLRSRARPGEQVWIHYSGHGGRVPTQHPGLKFSDLDEALVPTNIGDPKARYLRDVELAWLLEDLVDAGLIITVVLDCCHAGGAFRQGSEASPSEAPQPRGTGHPDPTPRPRRSLVATPARLRRTWRRCRAQTARALEPSTSWTFEPRGYVLLAACRAHEQAFETFHDGIFHQGQHLGGALTHWLLEALCALPREVTYRQLYERIKARFLEGRLGQTPQLEGPGDRLLPVPGLMSAPRQLPATVAGRPDSTVTVLEVDADTRMVLLNAGEVHALRPAIRFAVYPLAPATVPAAEVELVEVGAQVSWARLVSGALQDIEIGAPAIWARTGSPDRPGTRMVRLRAESASALARLEDLHQAIVADGILEVLSETEDPDETADFEVVATDCGYEVRGTSGHPLPGVAPLAYATSRCERRLAWNLVHLARFHDLHDLVHDDPTSPLRGALELELFGLPGPADGRVNPADLRRIDPPRGLRVGDWVCLKVKNTSYQVLNVTLLNLQQVDWRIEQIFPQQADFKPFEPDEEELLDFQLLPTGDGATGRELIKAFASIDVTNYRWLCLPPLGQSGSRQYRSLDFASSEWTVRDLPLEMVSHG